MLYLCIYGRIQNRDGLACCFCSCPCFVCALDERDRYMKIARLRKKRNRKVVDPLKNKELEIALLCIRYAKVNHMVKEIKRLCLDYRSYSK